MSADGKKITDLPRVPSLNPAAALLEIAQDSASFSATAEQVSEAVLATPNVWAQKQRFTPSEANPGLNVGSLGADPAGAEDGDIWYNSALGQVRVRRNGENISVGSGGGGATTLEQLSDVTVSSPAARQALVRNAGNTGWINSLIADSNIAAGAGISYSKLALAGSVRDSDIASGANIALSKLGATTANRALVTSSGGRVSASAITVAELGYLDGVTSAIQAQLDAKASTTHAATHAAGGSDPLTGNIDARSPLSIMVNTGTAALRRGINLIPGSNIQIVGADDPANDRVNVTITASAAPTPATEFSDATFRIFDDADNTKKISFSVGNISTGTVRQFVFPNASGTIATLAATQVLTNKTLTNPVVAGIHNNGALAMNIARSSTSNRYFNVSVSDTKVSISAHSTSSGQNGDLEVLALGSGVVRIPALDATAKGDYAVNGTDYDGVQRLALAASGNATLTPALSSGTLTVTISATGGGGATTLEALTDVTVSSPAAGQALVRNSSNDGWANALITNAGIAGSAAIAYSKLNLTGSITDSDISSSADIGWSKMATGATANRVVGVGPTRRFTLTNVSLTELGYLTGVTSAIQTQINAKASTTHASTHYSTGSDPLTGLLDANARLAIQVNSSNAGTGRTLNLIAGGNVTLTHAHVGETVSITIAATGGGTPVAGALESLSDVTITSAAASQVLMRNAANNGWVNSLISDASVAAGAAIAYSKLSLAGSITDADISASAAIAYSKLSLTGSIANADISASAAIAKSKLALTGAIANADISDSAAIAYGKLSLTGSIVNADVAAAAAIAYSKLALAGSIVNADISSSAAIAYSKLNLSGSITGSDISTTANIGWSRLAQGANANRVVGVGSNRRFTLTGISLTELGYLDNVTSNIQTQLNAKASTAHAATHAAGGTDELTGLLNATARTAFQKDGQAQGTGARRTLNLIEGANVSLTFADDSTNDVMSVTVAATGGGTPVQGSLGGLSDVTISSVQGGQVLAYDSGDSRWENSYIADANIAASAAIAYSKLSLSSSIVDSDISSSAAIAKSKLALTGMITDTDIANAAAIALSKLAAVSGSRALVSTAAGAMSASAVTATELGYLDGVTSAIQTQLNAKASTAHQATHQAGGTDELTGNLDAVARTAVSLAGATAVSRRGINFINGNNITVTVADDEANERVNVTITATGGGGGGNTFADNVFRIYDSDATTKNIAFDAAAITAGQTRTISMIDADLTLVGLTNAQTLTNKTLTNPTIATMSGVATVNHTGNLTFVGADGHTTFRINQASGNDAWVQVWSASGNGTPRIAANGTRDNVDLGLFARGSGSVIFNAPITMGSGRNINMTQTSVLEMNGGVIDGPSFIRDVNNNELIQFVAEGSAVNYLEIRNTTAPSITATGPAAAIGLTLATKGAGTILLSAATSLGGNALSNVSTISASGNVSIGGTLTTLGVLSAPQIYQVDSSDTGEATKLNLIGGDNVTLSQALSGGVLSVTIASTGGGGSQTPWAQNVDAGGFYLYNVATIRDANQNTLIGFMTPSRSSVDYVEIRNAPAAGTPAIWAAGPSTNVGLYLSPKGSSEHVTIRRPMLQAFSGSDDVAGIAIVGGTNVTVARTVASSNVVTWTISGASGTGNEFSDDSFRLWAGSDTTRKMRFNFTGTANSTVTYQLPSGTSLVSTTNTQTLTNKTLTTPKIGLIQSANGSNIFQFSGTVGATASYIRVSNSTTAAGPRIMSDFGSLANVDLRLQAKGTGKLHFDSATDFAGLNLHEPGTVVDSNGNELVEWGTFSSATTHIRIRNGGSNLSTVAGIEAVGSNYMQFNGMRVRGHQLLSATSEMIFYVSFNVGNPVLRLLGSGATRFEMGATGSNATLAVSGATNANLTLAAVGTGNIRMLQSLDMQSQSVFNFNHLWYQQGTLDYAAAPAVNMGGHEKVTMTVSGNITGMTTTGRAAGRSKMIIMEAGSASRTVTPNPSWKRNPSGVWTIPANGTAILSLYCKGANEGDIVAGFAVFS